MKEPQVFLDVMLHVGTLSAVFIVFRRDIAELLRAGLSIVKTRKVGTASSEKMLLAIIVGSVPTALIGFLFADQFERLFSSMLSAGIGLLLTGFLLKATQRQPQEEMARALDGSGGITVRQAGLIGTIQGLAIIPGISRSGSTIAVALLLGVPRETAARFSFLLSIPAILGALLLEGKDVLSAAGPGVTNMPATLAGTLIASGVGILSLALLLRIVRRGRISVFAYYCWLLGALAIIGGFLKG
jgi:undecaprenyl-diphosphatase